MHTPPISQTSAHISRLEWFGFIRTIIWQNTGFANLRKLQVHIENTPPRFDPTVVPFPEPSREAKKDLANGSNGHALAKKLLRKYYTVADYHRLYLSGELTPTAVAKAILPLIRKDTSPPGQHSIAFFDSKVDLVLAAAEASTLRYKEKRPLGPLDGVPTAIKDEYDIEGYITCLGSKNDYTGKPKDGSSITSWCVKKLEEAGAINVGKLHMHEFGLGSSLLPLSRSELICPDTSGNNPFKGTPPNPYNSQYYTGGSSSGCAYAVSTGLVPIALGGDGGGSIRIPASFCSVYGLKPSHGRLSFKPALNHSSTCAVNGPIASDIHSLSAIYQVLGAPDEESLFAAPSPTLLTPSANRKKVLGICEAWFSRATPAIQTLCRSMLDRLVSEHGYTLVDIKIPFLPEGQTAHAMTVLTDAATLLPVTKGLTPANRIMLALGNVTPSTDFLLAQKLRHVLMQHLAWLWMQHPGMVIVTPTTACAGWKVGKPVDLKYGISDGDQTLKTMEYVWMGNFCGLPSISVPAGFVVPEGRKGEGEVAEEGVQGKVPVGLMGMGEWATEEELLWFGGDCEDIGQERSSTPPIWVDVVERAKEEMKRTS